MIQLTLSTRDELTTCAVVCFAVLRECLRKLSLLSLDSVRNCKCSLLIVNVCRVWVPVHVSSFCEIYLSLSHIFQCHGNHFHVIRHLLADVEGWAGKSTHLNYCCFFVCRKSQETQKEMKLVLDVYKGAAKDLRDKVEVIQVVFNLCSRCVVTENIHTYTSLRKF